MDDMEHSYRMTMEMLRRHPEIDTLFVAASGTFGACRAVIELGREKNMRVIAFDTVPSTVEMIRRGLGKRGGVATAVFTGVSGGPCSV